MNWRTDISRRSPERGSPGTMLADGHIDGIVGYRTILVDPPACALIALDTGVTVHGRAQHLADHTAVTVSGILAFSANARITGVSSTAMLSRMRKTVDHRLPLSRPVLADLRR